MNPIGRRFLLLAVGTAFVFAAGCGDRDPAGLDVALAPNDPLVFDDALSPDVYFQPFFETHYLAASVDSVFAYNGFAPDGARSWKINVPPIGSSLGPYSGGVLTSIGPRDLTEYNALTFRVLTNADGTRLDEVGFGNDNTGTSLYDVSRAAVPLSGEWTLQVVPIPDPSKLIAERGLFLFAEGAEAAFPQGYDIWFDDIQFAKVDGINVLISQFTTNPSITRRYFIGTEVSAGGANTVFETAEGNLIVGHSSSYYELLSSNPSVATIARGGIIRIVGEGNSEITGKLQQLDVRGVVRLSGHRRPTVAASPPTLPAADVISLFSDVYEDVPVDTWRADYQGVTTQLQDTQVAGDNVKMYYDLNYVGVEFLSQLVDASQMTHFHVDAYAPEGTTFEVKLESIAADGSSVGASVFLSSDSTPAFVPGQWSSLDIPLTEFPVPEGWDWSRVGRLILAGSVDVQLVLVDNLYWHK